MDGDEHAEVYYLHVRHLGRWKFDKLYPAPYTKTEAERVLTVLKQHEPYLERKAIHIYSGHTVTVD